MSLICLGIIVLTSKQVYKEKHYHAVNLFLTHALQGGCFTYLATHSCFTIYHQMLVPGYTFMFYDISPNFCTRLHVHVSRYITKCLYPATHLCFTIYHQMPEPGYTFISKADQLRSACVICTC